MRYSWLGFAAIGCALALDWDGDHWTYLEVLTITALPPMIAAWARVRAAQIGAATDVDE